MISLLVEIFQFPTRIEKSSSSRVKSNVGVGRTSVKVVEVLGRASVEKGEKTVDRIASNSVIFVFC